VLCLATREITGEAFWLDWAEAQVSPTARSQEIIRASAAIATYFTSLSVIDGQNSTEFLAPAFPPNIEAGASFTVKPRVAVGPMVESWACVRNATRFGTIHFRRCAGDKPASRFYRVRSP